MELLWIILIIILAIVAVKLFSMFFSALARVLVVALVVIVVYVAFAHAAREQLFTGYVFPDQSITVDSKPFIIRFDPAQRPTTLQIDYYGKFYFVPKDTCKTITNIDFCFSDAIYDTYFGKYKANLTVYTVKPDISINRVINDSTLSVGDEAEISVNVTNSIGIAAESFEYIDSFSSDEFEISDVGGDCSKEGNNVVYRGVLREYKQISCDYTLKALKEVKRSLNAKVSYFDGTEKKYLFSNSIGIDVLPALIINTYFNDSDRKVVEGEKLLFLINLTNNKEEDIEDITLNISFPSGVIVDYSLFETVQLYYNETSNITLPSQKIQKIGEGIFQFRGSLKSAVGNKTKFIVLSIKAVKGGVSNIFIDASYTINDQDIFAEKKDYLEVEHKKIKLFTSFNNLDRFDSGEQKFFKIGISNPSELIRLYNVTLRVDTNLTNITPGNISLLDKMGSIYLVNQNVQLPSLDYDRSYPFDVVVDYDTEYGEHFQEIFEYDLAVDTIAGLTLSHDMSKTTVESGEQFTVQTNIKNERNIDIKNIRVFDVVPMEFIREGLNSISNLNINANDDVTAYEYRMTAPVVATPKTFYFRSTAVYDYNNKTYAYERVDSVNVQPKTVEISLTRVIADPSQFMGSILDIIYTISNPEEKEALKNVQLIFPLQQNMDLVDVNNFTIDELFPGESFTVRDTHRIRAKENGSLTLVPTQVRYEDENGNIFFKNTSDLTFDAKQGYVSGPAFVVNRISNRSVYVGDYIDSIILVNNTGSEKGDVVVSDGEDNWQLTIAPKEIDRITFRIKAVKEETVEFKPVTAEYNYQGKKFMTISNSAYTNVTKKLDVKAPAPQQEQIKEVVVEKLTPSEQKKTFFGMIWDAIKSALDIFRR